MKYHNSLYKQKHFFIFGLYHTCWISCNFGWVYVLYLLKRFVFLSLFRPLTCTVYILNVLLMVLLVSGVYVRVHVTTQRKPLSRVNVFRGTWAQMCAREQVMVVTFVKWINSFYFIRMLCSCFISTFFRWREPKGSHAAQANCLFITEENTACW